MCPFLFGVQCANGPGIVLVCVEEVTGGRTYVSGR